MGVWSDAYFKKLTREVVSEELGKNASGNLPLDKKHLTLQYVQVDKIFPYSNEILCHIRGDSVNNSFVASILAPMMAIDIYETWNPETELKRDGKTGKLAITPSEILIGAVMAVEGEPDEHGWVFLGYVHMPGEPALQPINGGYALKYGNSFLKITNDNISLQADIIDINQEEIVNLATIDEKINQLTPGIVNDLTPGIVNNLAPGLADDEIDTIVPGMIDTAIEDANIPTNPYIASIADDEIESLAPGIADTEINSLVPGMINNALNVGNSSIDINTNDIGIIAPLLLLNDELTVRKNLFVPNIASGGDYLGDTTGTSAQGSATITYDTTWAKSGTGSFKVVTGNVATGEGIIFASSDPMPAITPGRQIVSQAWVKGNGYTAALNIYGRNSAGSIVESITGDVVTLTDNANRLAVGGSFVDSSIVKVNAKLITGSKQAATFWVDEPYIGFGGDDLKTACMVSETGQGHLHLSNGLYIEWGNVSITPSGANTPTSAAVTFAHTISHGNVYTAYYGSVPGTQVTGHSHNGLSTTGVNIWVTRTNTTATQINWMFIGTLA